MAFEDNNKFYKSSLKKHGLSAQGVHWNSKYTQYKRFEILSSFIKSDIKNSSIVDVGCGFAEYYSYLKKINKTPKEYIGLDCEQSMIEISQKRFKNLVFKKKNILKDTLEEADYYVCSGALNILTKKEFFIFLSKCIEKCKKGFIFNFLKEDSYNYIKKEEILYFCENLNLNLEIQTKDNYLENDFTIFLKKQNII